MKLTYKQAEDRIFKAYFNDEIKPLNPNFCFCGTLAPDSSWRNLYGHKLLEYPFTVEEYIKMEQALFSAFPGELDINKTGIVEIFNNDEFKRNICEPKSPYIISISMQDKIVLDNIDNYEDKIFQGMCNALEVLKDIYIQRGEIVDFQLLKKRELVLL